MIGDAGPNTEKEVKDRRNDKKIGLGNDYWLRTRWSEITNYKKECEILN